MIRGLTKLISIFVGPFSFYLKAYRNFFFIALHFFRLPSRALLFASLGFLITSLIPISAFAATVYQQLSDSTGRLVTHGTPYQEVTSFTVNQPYVLGADSVIFIAGQTLVGTPTISFTIGETPATTGSGCSITTPAVDGQNHFLKAIGCTATLVPGVTYHIYISGTLNSFEFFTDYTKLYLYGFVSTNDVPTLPTEAGIPGFSDTGIATSSQQVYCATQLSSTTGFLDGLGHSFAQGICNVTVFLFVPSENAVVQFQTLASTTQTKVPFSYAYEFVSDFRSLSASTSTNLPTWAIDFGSVDLGSSTPMGQLFSPVLTFFSTTTISKYLPDNVRLPLLTLERFAIWFGVVYLFYRKIIPDKPHLMRT